MAIKFRELEVFWAVLKTGSVKDAAHLLHVSQPAVSMMLRSAEDHFGFPLFDRSAGRVQPTADARALFPMLNNTFTELREFERHVERVREKQVGVLNVACNPTLVTAYVHRVLPEFIKKHPDIEVAIRSGPTFSVVDLVARHQVDFGLTYEPFGNAETEVEYLGKATISCVLHKGHKLAGLSSVTPAHLAGERVLSYRADAPLGREIARTFRSTGERLHLALQADGLTAGILAAKGAGVALIDHRILVGQLRDNIVVVPFRPVTSVKVQFMNPKGEPLSRIAQEFQASLKRRFSKS